MDSLNKQQVILLAILVAFVTSITTGIVVVSLADQTERTVPQTIYKVVERTIQEVTPAESPVRKIVEIEKPKEKVLVLSDVVSIAEQSLVKVYWKDKDKNEILVSVGAIFGGKDMFLGVDPVGLLDQTKVSIELPNKTRVEGTLNKKPNTYGLALFKINEKDKPTVTSLKVAGTESAKLGSSVIAFGAKKDTNVVSTGIVAELENTTQATTTKASDYLITDIRLSSPTSGWLLLSTNAEVLGFISPGREGDKGARYINATLLKSVFPDMF